MVNKLLITILLVLLAAPVSAFQVLRGSGGATCSTPTGHTYDQGFEDAFPITGWTTAGTVASGSSLSGTPPVASCSKGFYTDGTTISSAYYDIGSNTASYYFRLDFKYTGGFTSAWTDENIYSSGESSGGYNSTVGVGLVINRDGAADKFLRTIPDATTIITNPVSGTYYRVTGYVSQTTPTNSWIKVNGGTAISFTPSGSNLSRYFWMGNMNTGSNAGAAIDIGYFAINNTEISGADISNP